MLLYLFTLTFLSFFTVFVESATIPISPVDKPSLNGTWQLDRVNSESIDDLLQLMGVGIWKRRIIRTLDITDQYEITSTTFHIIRDTSRSHKNETYKFNQEEDINDELLGSVKQTTSYSNGKLTVQLVQPNKARAITIRRLSPTDSNKMIYISNYTVSDGSITKSVIRYFKRK